MRWFQRAERKDVWDDDAPDAINDLEAARRIRNICEAAGDIAKSPNGRADASVDERCQRASRAAMHIALKISDDLLRDAALRQIIDLCVKASKHRTAEILLRAIQAETVREAILNDNPTLRI
jgi:hypothetical protein